MRCLLILLLVIPSLSFSQVRKSVRSEYYPKGGVVPIDSTKAFGWVFHYQGVEKEDTIRVMILYCDTTHRTIMFSDNYKFATVTFWQFGYIITSWSKEYFLDAEKKRLDSNIVVWDYIPTR